VPCTLGERRFDSPRNRQYTTKQGDGKGWQNVRITSLVWLEDVIEKLETKHGVSPEEVEEVFGSKPRIKKMSRGRPYGNRGSRH
jgi:hypothetical protein